MVEKENMLEIQTRISCLDMPPSQRMHPNATPGG
jgi:hypothetical protein